ncbi:hypothetical protein RclHR1_04730012 [Rhizophagus clarus]|uniref:Uncharacterized protein n=1 Tax=Rhizophagus clarus TaxID=94130 RepID=A0A2Z6RKE8_9GLOM|nr:hypothetical protein RclHR1_04730012 [Rhizophagus clarus]
MVLAKDYRRNTHLGSLVCQQRQAQSKEHRVTLLQETQFLSAHSVLYLWYWLKTIEEIPTFLHPYPSTLVAKPSSLIKLMSIFERGQPCY